MAKTTDALRFDSLFMEYKILHKIDTSKADETFAELFNEYVKQCADELYKGDITNVTLNKALYNNLVSDKRTRFNNPGKYFNGYLPEKTLKLQLVELIDTLLPKDNRTTRKQNVAPSGIAKSYWMYDKEDIEKINDPKVLDSVYNNISSALSRETTLRLAIKHFGLTEDQVIERLKAVRTLARKQKARLSKPQLSDKLVNKLQKGGKVTLSAAEAEELRKLLG